MKFFSYCVTFVFLVSSLWSEEDKTFFQEYSPGVVYIQQSVKIAKSDISYGVAFDKFVKKLGTPLYNEDLYLPLISGSGFFIDQKGHLLTNWHVLDAQGVGDSKKWGPVHWIWYIEKNFSEAEMPAEEKFNLENSLAKAIDKGELKTLVLVSNETFYEPKTLAFDVEHDLALLEIPMKDSKGLKLAPEQSPKVGSDVFSFGYPLGENTVQNIKNLTATFTKGSISAIRDGTLALEHTATINGGNSGGPLIDQVGNILGVNTAVKQNTNNMYYAIPAKIIRQFLKTNDFSDLIK